MASLQGILQPWSYRPTAAVQYEPMFASNRRATDTAADLIDLAIEFMTLGEYGLEYPEEVSGPPANGTDCPAQVRRRRPPRSKDASVARNIRGRTGGLPEALQPPRLRLECLGDEA